MILHFVMSIVTYGFDVKDQKSIVNKLKHFDLPQIDASERFQAITIKYYN